MKSLCTSLVFYEVLHFAETANNLQESVPPAYSSLLKPIVYTNKVIYTADLFEKFRQQYSPRYILASRPHQRFNKSGKNNKFHKQRVEHQRLPFENITYVINLFRTLHMKLYQNKPCVVVPIEAST